MSGDAPGAPAPGTRDPRRRRLLAVAAAVVVLVALAVVLVVVLTNRDGSERRASATTSSAGTSSAEPSPSEPSPSEPSPSPAPTGEPGSPVVPGSVDDLPVSLPQVGLQDTAAVGDGVTVAVASVERFQGEGVGAGNVSGPALRVTLRLTNGTAEAVDLGSVTVNAASGADVTPAPDLNDVSRAPFSGSVAPGGTAEGAYTFSVPAGALDPVVIEVGYRPGAPLVLFVGPVA